MEIKKITDKAFAKYGRIIEGMDFMELLHLLEKTPDIEGVLYEPSVEALENCSVYEELKSKTYGEMDIQIGYCIGENHYLNALEYHRTSEINIAGTDAILILGCQQDVSDDYTYDTAKAEMFLLPKGVAVEFYATTLHYAPCSVGDNQFKVVVVLPRYTNYPLEDQHEGKEDKLMTAKNKWLIGHPEGGLPEGTHIGLIGENLCTRNS